MGVACTCRAKAPAGRRPPGAQGGPRRYGTPRGSSARRRQCIDPPPAPWPAVSNRTRQRAPPALAHWRTGPWHAGRYATKGACFTPPSCGRGGDSAHLADADSAARRRRRGPRHEGNTGLQKAIAAQAGRDGTVHADRYVTQGSPKRLPPMSSSFFIEGDVMQSARHCAPGTQGPRHGAIPAAAVAATDGRVFCTLASGPTTTRRVCAPA